MKQNLGKIIILIALSINLIAGVNLTVNPSVIYKGDSATFTITADSEDVKFPDIDEVKGYAIQGTSSSSSTSIINGDVSKKISKTYQFAPQKTVTIPSYKVEVDGKVYKTKEIKIKVIKPTASKNGSSFVVESSVDKKEAHVGEAINFTIIFKQRLDAKAAKLQLGEPKLENFWIKKVDSVEKSTEGEYMVQKIHYLLFPQKAGNYTIGSIEADIGRVMQRQRRSSSMFNDPFFDDPFFSSFATNQIKWQKIFSNEIKLDIKPLPNNLELFGDFKILATVDKEQTKANKPVNLTINIQGKGNIDDVKKFNLDIEDAIIYADEPNVNAHFIGDEYGGDFTQKIAIIADKNYTIPPIKLTFVDKKTNKVKTVKTKPIDIVVKGGSGQTRSEKPTIEVKEDNQPVAVKSQKSVKTKVAQTAQEESYIKYLFLVIGLFLGMLISYLFKHFGQIKEKQEIPILKAIKKAKTDKALFETLLPHAKEGKLISDTLQKLEENIYKNGSCKIDKDELMDFFEDMSL